MGEVILQGYKRAYEVTKERTRLQGSTEGYKVAICTVFIGRIPRTVFVRSSKSVPLEPQREREREREREKKETFSDGPTPNSHLIPHSNESIFCL